VVVPEGHPLAVPVGEFLGDLVNAGRSRHTVRGYRGDLAGFAAAQAGAVGRIDPACVEGRRPADQAVHLVALCEEQLGKIRTILSRDSRNERTFRHLLPAFVASSLIQRSNRSIAKSRDSVSPQNFLPASPSLRARARPRPSSTAAFSSAAGWLRQS
jgi:hypothetical protein